MHHCTAQLCRAGSGQKPAGPPGQMRVGSACSAASCSRRAGGQPLLVLLLHRRSAFARVHLAGATHPGSAQHRAIARVGSGVTVVRNGCAYRASRPLPSPRPIPGLLSCYGTSAWQARPRTLLPLHGTQTGLHTGSTRVSVPRDKSLVAPTAASWAPRPHCQCDVIHKLHPRCVPRRVATHGGRGASKLSTQPRTAA